MKWTTFIFIYWLVSLHYKRVFLIYNEKKNVNISSFLVSCLKFVIKQQYCWKIMCRKMKNREILISIYFDVEFNNLKCILPLDNLQVSSLITSDMKETKKNYVWSKESKINSPFSVNHVRFRLFSYFSFWFFIFLNFFLG